jgi:TolB-like protein/tetratricopeptide (TPR) repeat protein
MYVVGAWLVVQVADIVFPAWDVPDAGIRYLIYAAIICFPLALVFSWFFDVSKSGIVRTLPASTGEDSDLSLRRSDYVLLAALLTIGALVIAGSLRQIPGATDVPAGETDVDDRPPNSVAVMPFENLTGNDEETYFSDGIAEEILHRLAASNKLRVMSRSSSFAFRQQEFAPRQICALLGVRYLLSGTVGHDDGQVRISATLLDHAGFQVWSRTLEGARSEIFDLQATISRGVAETIAGEIVESGAAADSRTTKNPDAYRHYLIGKELSNTRAAGWQARAIEAFRNAIAADPAYAPPYTGIAIASLISGERRPWSEREPEILQVIDTALRLQPDLADGYAARGLYYHMGVLAGHLEPERTQDAITDLRRAISLDPSHGMAYNWLLGALTELERDDEAHEVLLQGLEVDPLNPPLTINAVMGDINRGGDPLEGEQRLRAMQNWPIPSPEAYGALRYLMGMLGRADEAVEVSKDVIRAEDYESGYWSLYFAYNALGMFDDALFWVDIAAKQFRDSPMWSVFVESHRMEILTARGDIQGATTIFERLMGPTLAIWDDMSRGDQLASGIEAVRYNRPEVAADIFSKTLVGEPRRQDMRAYSYWYVALHSLDETEKAAEVGRIMDDLATELKPFEGDPGSQRRHADWKTMYYLAKTDTAAAARTLAHAIELGWHDYYMAIADPVWKDHLAEHELQVVLAKLKADLDRQKANVEAADREHDFRAETLAALEEEE